MSVELVVIAPGLIGLQRQLAGLGATSWCAPRTVQAQVTGFPATGQLVVTGDNVTVTVQCAVNMSPFTVLGFNPAMVFSGRAVAPLDAFVERNG